MNNSYRGAGGTDYLEFPEPENACQEYTLRFTIITAIGCISPFLPTNKDGEKN